MGAAFRQTPGALQGLLLLLGVSPAHHPPASARCLAGLSVGTSLLPDKQKARFTFVYKGTVVERLSLLCREGKNTLGLTEFMV